MDKILKKAKKLLPMAAAAGALALLMAYSADAQSGARRGLLLCAGSIIPALFPFFAVSSLLNRLGFPACLARLTQGVTRRLFGVSGQGAAAFVIGLTGGYPLGAAAVAELYAAGSVSRKEAERLLAFCNNSGPAFILGAAGVGVFASARLGLALYAAHVLAAALTGVLLRGRGSRTDGEAGKPAVSVAAFPQALAESVKGAVTATLSVCGFVVFFSALTEVLTAAGLFSALAGRLSLALGAELRWCRALLSGILELGTGIAALSGMEVSGANLSLCAFLLGWGGLSVHCQTLAVLSGTGLSPARHFLGRLLCGLLAAGLMAVFSLFL